MVNCIIKKHKILGLIFVNCPDFLLPHRAERTGKSLEKNTFLGRYLQYFIHIDLFINFHRITGMPSDGMFLNDFFGHIENARNVDIHIIILFINCSLNLIN